MVNCNKIRYSAPAHCVAYFARLHYRRVRGVTSMLRRYRSDPSHILPVEEIEVKQLRNKQIPLVKVLWNHHSGQEATWEHKEDMRR